MPKKIKETNSATQSAIHAVQFSLASQQQHSVFLGYLEQVGGEDIVCMWSSEKKKGNSFTPLEVEKTCIQYHTQT